MGKRGPKPQFIDVVCPNKACELYGLTDQGTIVGNGTSISRGVEEFPRTGKRGRPRNPKTIPPDILEYAQVIKKRK